MLTKLLSILSTAKGAAAATVIAAAAVGTGVVATNTDVQNTLGDTLHGAVNTHSPEPSGSGKPAVVASRNAADKKLRDAFQDDQKALEKLRSTKVAPADRGKLEDTVKTADSALHARLTKALNDVAALTLGREGLESGSPKPSGSASPDVKASFSPATQAKVDAIVTTAISDMKTIVSDAEKAVAALPTSEPGKPSGEPGAKPGNAGKPGELPAHATPTAKPSR